MSQGHGIKGATTDTAYNVHCILNTEEKDKNKNIAEFEETMT